MNSGIFKSLVAISAFALCVTTAHAQSADAPADPPAADSAATAPADDPAKVYTMDDLKTEFNAQQYQLVLKQITRIQANPKELAGFNTYDLVMLRAETELHWKLAYNASLSFASAAKNAPDAKTAAVDNAYSILVKRSTNGVYTPRHQADATNKQTFNIVDADQRKTALTPLFDDEKTDAMPAITSAQNGTSLPPIVSVCPALNNLDPLEVAATGEDTYVAGERKTLATHALELIRNALDPMQNRVNAIKQNANTQVEQDVPIYNAQGRQTGVNRNYYRRGLSSGDAQTLRNIISTTSMIAPAANDLSNGLKQQGDPFNRVITQARDINNNANNVLNANYGGVVRQN